MIFRFSNSLPRVGSRRVHPITPLWLLFSSTALLAAAAGTAGVLSAMRLSSKEHLLVGELATALEHLPVATTSENAASESLLQGDFTRHLMGPVDRQRILSEIQRICTRAEVKLGTMQIQERATGSDQLPRTYFDVSLRGRYPKLKEVMAEGLGRFPNATLAQMSMRQSAVSPDGEATMSLVFWSGPVASIASPRASASDTASR